MKDCLILFCLINIISLKAQVRYEHYETKKVGNILIVKATGEKVNGIVYKLKNNKLKYEHNYKNGLQHGLSRAWSEGNKTSKEEVYYEGNFIEGRGFVKGWYKNGQIAYEGFTIDGEPSGLIRFWNEKGQLKEEELYINGEKILELF